MRSATETSLGKGHLFWSGRLRGLFSGLGYAVTLTLFLAISWSLETHVNDLPNLSALEGLRRIAVTGVQHAAATLPMVPLLILVLNIGPRRALKRAAWLMAAIAAMALWSSFYMLNGVHDPAWPGYFTERLLAAALVAAACLYRGSMRGAVGTLMRTQIESATLTVELERARLQMLRSQIEPHFLFNSLANVRRLAHIDRTAAVEMLDNLMRYLAAALPKLRQDDSPLAEEMQLIDAYLSIFRVRMGARLSYAVALPPDLAAQRVPTMMLLTLVENALKHGINPVVEGGFIRVSAVRSGTALILKVADSGTGITTQQDHGSGAGLANVRLRLKMQYGEAAVLSLAHAEPRGVVATISLPMGQAL
jgi:signal transduction histidine kinase